MPKLSEIVGGLMRDLARSHVVADAQTRQVFESYQKDPVLAHFPVPRITIKQATVKLKFSITSHAPPATPPDPREFQALLGKSIRERMLPDFLLGIGKLDNREVTARLTADIEKAGLHSRIQGAQLVDPQKLPQLQQDVSALLVEQIRALPKYIFKQLPEGEIDAAVKKAVAREMREVQRAAINLKQAMESAQNDLDVAVRAEELKALADTQLNELELTVNLEDVEGRVPG